MKDAPLRPEIERALRAVEAKQGADVVLLKLGEAASFTDYFILCTGFSSRQAQAIADAVEEELAALRLTPHHVEGYQQAEWVLLDYGGFVVHIFTERARAYYDLERLWRKAARLPVPEDTPQKTRLRPAEESEAGRTKRGTGGQDGT